MAEVAQVTPPQGGDGISGRGRGGRGGRGWRGGRGYRGGPRRGRGNGRPNEDRANVQTDSAQQSAAATTTEAPVRAPEPRIQPSTEASQESTGDAPQSGPSRGGRGRRGGPRRGRGSGRPNNDRPDSAQPAAPEAIIERPAEISQEAARGGSQAGPSRVDGGRRGGRRGRGSTNQRSIVVSHRSRGGPPSQQPPAQDYSGDDSATGLSPVANEFVPGQPVGAVHKTAPVAPKTKPAPKKTTKSTAEDLPTRIHEDIDNEQYECVICTGEVVRSSRVWSCSICWTVTHLHCVKKWHTNQMKKAEEDRRSQNQNGEDQATTSWRCPGCNSSLTDAPGPHRCWCGKEQDPRPIPGLPPHTCGQTCHKTRATCPHPCSLMCHAGPCPPCTLMGPEQVCFCGKHTSTKRCIETEYGKGFSCGEICGDLLPCGEHECPQPCHTGLCGACKVTVVATCYCGKEHRNMPCEQRDEILESFNYGQVNSLEDGEEWFEGSFDCKKVCGRPFDCGHHTCQKQCHAQEEQPAHCPLSPDVVTTCPCGKTSLTTLITEPRKSCQDPIPHCKEVCKKTLPCGHFCPQKCHDGPCPDCEQMVEIPCRCGRTTQELVCHKGTEEQPQCERICRIQRNCGRHECGKVCCTGEKKGAERKRLQKRGGGATSSTNNNNNQDNFEAEHICLQVCGRQLKCGKHACQQLCHRGPCPSCPEAIFDEIACSCGKTVLQPPQPCGTRPPECRFPCNKARPCGHPAVSHQCHPEDTPCPKCPFLVEKACICGKKALKNQPCWFDEVRCGLPCGKKLKCGAHECKKTCHRPGECEDVGIPGTHCSQPCGRVRKSCEHTCQETCHAPLPCKEDNPCPSKTFITCPCQNRKQEVRCLATRINPRDKDSSTSSGGANSLKCDDECLRLQRNRRLADALNIDPETHTDAHIPYSDTTLKLYRENIPFAQTIEREFRVFASAEEGGAKRLRFKPMPGYQRMFIHSLAEDYGLDSESQDPEPHRHVCIFKTPRFVAAPRKTLGQCVSLKLAPGGAGTSASLVRGGDGKTAASQLNALKAQQAQLQQQPAALNALLMRSPRFGLTIDEVEEGLSGELKKSGVVKVGLMNVRVEFVVRFLAGEEVVVIAVPSSSSSSGSGTAGGGGSAPQDKAIETMLTNLRPAISKTVVRLGLASKEVVLCRVDDTSSPSPAITRREGDGPSSTTTSEKATTLAGGWSAVASRGGWKRSAASQPAQQAGQQAQGSTAAGGTPSFASAIAAGGADGGMVHLKGRNALPSAAPAPAGRQFVALLRKKERKPEQVVVVEDDWLVAAEKEENNGGGGGGGGGSSGGGEENAATMTEVGKYNQNIDWAEDGHEEAEESASVGGEETSGSGSEAEEGKNKAPVPAQDEEEEVKESAGSEKEDDEKPKEVAEGDEKIVTGEETTKDVSVDGGDHAVVGVSISPPAADADSHTALPPTTTAPAA